MHQRGLIYPATFSSPFLSSAGLLIIDVVHLDCVYAGILFLSCTVPLYYPKTICLARLALKTLKASIQKILSSVIQQIWWFG
jgi:hypothetical protein